MRPERALLAGAIDYAGLFPPAHLPLADALANYRRYSGSDQAWALGRFVVSVAQLQETNLADVCLAVVGSRDANADAEAVQSRPIAVIEAVTPSVAAVRERLAAHPAATCYCEIDPGSEHFGAVSAAVKQGGGRAKIRTGGVVAGAIPSVETVLAFLLRCCELNLPCKATAGLHHPVRGEYALTYAPDAPRATMHGYLNLMLAYVCLRQAGSLKEARDLLETEDIGMLWPPRWSADQIADARTSMTGFGSCSFEEPLQWLSNR